ncbi:uncharacterized protein A4U43_C09F5740 [Asparagus officinalis]|uniref:Uncharacterized protein n=1 Tax=Asparagus officinalis TaxID=4686 RepID=A0A5P1E5U8_ASPOF|nr:probable E3 ubiquitin ligase SUD1 [Asparagus officinalis]ONK57930.1 uncharacterized protein A4U43_C09F5740 [Asparagus officinalis]
MASEIVVCVAEPSASSSSEPRNNGGCPAVPQEEVRRRGGDEEEGLVQCRICLEEGNQSEMEAPCGCSGSIKFAHRSCLQKWCNEKEGIICEICKKIYPLRYIPESRGWWEMNSTSIRQDFLEPIDEESLAAACLASTLLMLFLLHYIFMIMGDWGIVQDVSVYFKATLFIAILLLPCCAIGRYCYRLRNQHRREHGA